MGHFVFLIFLVVYSFELFSEEEIEPQMDDSNSVIEESKPEEKNQSKSGEVRIELAKLGNDFISFISSGKWKEAEKIVSEIQKISGDSVEYNYFKSALLYSTGDFQKPIELLNRAIELNPNHDPSYYLLGMIHGKFRNWVKSIYYLEIAASKGSYNPFYHYNLSIAYFLNKDYASAKITLEKTLELKDNYHLAKLLLLQSLIKLNNTEEALALCERYESENLKVGRFREIYANLLFEVRKNSTKVIAILTEIKNLHLDSKRSLANALFMENRFLESMAVFKQIFQTGLEIENDHKVYLQILLYLDKDNEFENYILAWIRKSPSEKEKILELRKNFLIEREVFRTTYKPIPWR
ncbi:MAG: hypothetical protein HS129_00155 [Leptospiraceae bacterium]|nr:hypothetical protein [Leptospiraceae bacterium]